MDSRFKTNSERANVMGLRPAPLVKGYSWSRLEVDGIIKWNKEFEKGKCSKPRLLGMFLDLTPSCNLNCSFCYASRIPLKDKEKPIMGLTLEELKCCVDVARKFDAETIAVAGKGEPFLDPSLLPLARYVTEKGMWFVVFTNNTLITAEIAKELATLNVSVIAKLGSLDPKMQDKIVGVPNAHKLIYAGRQNLINAGFSEPRLAIDATIFRKVLDDVIGVFRYCRKNRIIPYLEPLMETGFVIKNGIQSQQLSQAELVRFFEILRDIDEKEFGYTWVIRPGMHTIAYEECRKSLTTVSVRGDGNVDACVNRFSTGIGNIRETKLEELITNSPVLKQIRKSGAPCCSGICTG
jgi:MoaA/NifB/PqqE/SkfB family radical SAM enzyme